MKLSGARIEAFLRRPDPAISVVLLYGPEQGLVEERARDLVHAVVGAGTDPFRLSELPADALKGDPTRLLDEAASLPFTGGRRVVRVRQAIDACTAAVRAVLDGAPPGLVVLEAGELGPRSSLRLAAESAPAAAAIGCYPDDDKAIGELVRTSLATASISIAPDALEMLTGLLGANRIASRNELDKLAAYVGAGGRVAVEDVQAVVGDAGAASLDAIVYAVAEGDMRALDRALATAFAEGESPIVVLRSVARHLLRLTQARIDMAARGTSARQAMETLRPAVIFRLQARFATALHRWDRQKLAAALTILAEAELAGKRTGAPQHGLCCHALLRIAALATTRSATGSV